MTICNVKLKDGSGNYLYPYTDNIPYASDNIAGKVQLDNTPIFNSSNAITSGAVYNLIDSLSSHSIYQKSVEITDENIILQDDISIYTKTVTGNLIFTFNTEQLTKTGRIITFELYLTLTSDYLPVLFPPTVQWINNTMPETTIAQKYLFAFRSFDNGETWIGNLQGTFT